MKLKTTFLLFFLISIAAYSLPAEEAAVSTTPSIQTLQGRLQSIDLDGHQITITTHEKKNIALLFHPKNSKIWVQGSTTNLDWKKLRIGDETVIRYVDESGKLFIRSLQLTSHHPL